MKIKILFLLAILHLFSSCENQKPDPVPPVPSDGRTVLMYMVANNDINSSLLVDINEMERAWSDNYGGKLYVFLNTLGNKNYLYEIKHDEDRFTIASPIVKEYSSNNDACDPLFLRAVVDDVIALAPAKSYGLFMSSHGSGWVANGGVPFRTASDANAPMYDPLTTSKLGVPDENDLPVKRTIGKTWQYSTQLEMYDIARVLQGLSFEYIYFDACHMASVESTYALRGVAKYVIASVAETLVAGAPYDEITQDMFGEAKTSSVTMATKFYDYFNRQSGVARSATISVVDPMKLEAVAAKLKNVVTYQPVVSMATIQQFGRSLMGYGNVYFDLMDFVNKTWGTTNPQGVAEFKTALENAVEYKAATPILFQGDRYGSITVNTHCGLSAYIPVASQLKTLNTYRTKYDWSTDSGLSTMVF